MVRCGPDLVVNPTHVSHMEWDRRYYFNGPGDSTLVITMVEGHVLRIRHEPQLLGGTDAYDIERQILDAI